MKKIIFFATLFFVFATSAIAQKEQTIDRDSFSLKFPQGWTIDKEDEDYDPDALFSLDSPGDNNSSVMFMIFSLPIDPDEMLDEQEKNMKKGLIKASGPTVTFTSWGNYQGKGRIIEGKILGIFKGKIKFFMYTDASKSMLVMEQLYESESQKTEAGFKMIAESFRFK